MNHPDVSFPGGSSLVLFGCLVLSVSAPADEVSPDFTERVFGDKRQEVWARLKADGKVTADEVLEACYDHGRPRHDGDGQLDAAVVLVTIDDDPIPALRKMMKHETAERRAFAAVTAGIIGDKRSIPDLEKLKDDPAKLGQVSGEWFWDTVGVAAVEALRSSAKAGILEAAEGKIKKPAWYQPAGKTGARIDKPEPSEADSEKGDGK